MIKLIVLFTTLLITFEIFVAELSTESEENYNAKANESTTKRPLSTYLMILNGLDHGEHSNFGLKILAFILNIVTKICCVFTLICLAICVWAFSAYKSLYSLRNTIHRNLCITLLLAEFFFLLGLHGFEIKTNESTCRAIAITLHYLFLCAYAWMLLEAYQIYRQLICVFESNRNRLALFYVAGYILPAIIVGITASFFYDDYGTKLYCWIDFTSTTIWALVGPVAAIFSFNFIVLIMALYVLIKNSKNTLPVQSELSSNESILIKNAEVRKRRRFFGWIKASASLVCLLGLSWIFGFLTTIYTHGHIVAIVFTTLNCIQGIFIFVMHVLLNENVRTTVWGSINDRFPYMKRPIIIILLFCILSFVLYHLFIKFIF